MSCQDFFGGRQVVSLFPKIRLKENDLNALVCICTGKRQNWLDDIPNVDDPVKELEDGVGVDQTGAGILVRQVQQLWTYLMIQNIYIPTINANQ